MGERGGIHVYHARWTQWDPTTGLRVTVESDLWRWRFSYRGKRYEGGPGERTQAAARAHGEKRKAEVAAGQEQDPRKTTFETLRILIAAEQTVKDPATQASFRAVWKRLGGFFAGNLAMDITRTRALEYAARQKTAGYQPSTINLDLQYLTTAMRLAQEAGKLLVAPRLPRLKRTKREVTFQPQEFEALLAALPEWWRRFFLIADEMGWRCRKELRSRQWQHVDFERGWVVLEAESSKTDKRRVFPMTKHLRALLEDQRAWVAEIEQRTEQIIPFVFCDARGWELGDYRKVWATALKRAGFGKLEGRTGPWSSAKVAHDIRRTALTRWDDAELPRSASRGMAGHNSDQTFSGYAQATPQALRRAAEKLDAYRERQAGETPKVSPLKKTGG